VANKDNVTFLEEGNKHTIVHGLYLTVGATSSGDTAAIISDGSPQRGDVDVIVLATRIVNSHEEAEEWFEEMCAACCVKPKYH